LLEKEKKVGYGKARLWKNESSEHGDRFRASGAAN